MNMDDMLPGVDGQYQSQGVWGWRDRAESISYRELKAIRMLLSGRFGNVLSDFKRSDLLLHVDNQAVVHITNSLVSASRPMMRELRRLKVLLDHHGIRIRAEWIPSVAIADALSGRFPRGDLQIRRQVRRSVLAGMNAPIEAFRFRPIGEHPRYLRHSIYQELSRSWGREEVRLLCPPVDLIMAVVHKLRESRAPALLLIPDWSRQPWHSPAIQMASRVDQVNGCPEDLWAAQRQLNPKWKLLILEVNLE